MKLVRRLFECLMFGIFAALLLLLLGVAGLVAYGMLTGQSLHLALFSLPLAELEGGSAFSIALDLKNMALIGGILALLCTVPAWFLGLGRSGTSSGTGSGI
ncbi:hypothetical protein [Thermogemmatispora carboxidivorans]|uniref:hypothetical protein n=1 Tax=Thermogemmatispora carboxidivorans TaxID=1382306 RepID=UPI00069A7EB5|nr:hypothetical protein [Thermogemmatispora carboxidivorans]